MEGLNILERLKYNLEAQLKMLKSKKQLTSDVLQQTMAVYVENLKQIGVDIMDYMPEGSFHIDDNANITFQMNKSGELPFVLPEAVYSPAVTNVEDPEGNYQQFCQEIQARNLEVEHPSFFESESQNDAALSLMISQNFNRIVENRSKINSNDVHEVSGSFKCPNSSIPWRSNTLSNIQSREQNSFDLDSMERSKSVEDPNVSGALEDLQECSSYFTQDWDELDGNPKESEVMERTSAVDVEKSPPKSNVVIQTVHIFDQNDQLLKVQRFDRETGALIEKNSQEDCLDKIEGRSNYSDESFHFAKAGDNSISINNATFLTSEDKVNFEELKQDFDANSDRSFVMNFATPISGKTKSIDDLNRPQLQSNNDQSFRMDFQGKPLKIDSQKRFFEATREKDLTNQNTILTSDSNSFYSLRTNTEDTKQFNYNSQRSSITQFKEISSKPNSQISQKESIFDILNEMQRSKSLETREHFSNISGTNNSRISSLTNSLRFTTLNRKDFSQKTYSNTFFEIQARNDALRIQKSKEIAAKSSLEPTDSKGLQNKANSSNLISEKSSKDSEDAGNVNNTNIWGETQENTFDSHCSTLKLYPNRSLNTSGVGQNKRIEDFDRSNSNLLEISNENGEMTAKVLCNDIFNTSGKRQTEGFDNLNRSNSSLFKISKRKEKISPQKMFQEEFLNTSGVSQTEELEGFNRSNNNLIKIANKKKKINPNVSCEDVFNASGISQTEEFENFNRSSSILEKSFVSGKYQIETFENLNRSNSNLFKIISKKEKSSPKALNEDALNTSGMNQTERFENFNQINSKLLENAQEDDKISPKIIYKHVSNTSGVSKTQRFKNFNGNSDIFSKSIETDEEINAKFSYKDMSNISGVSQTENFENVDGSSNNFPKITKNDEKINSKVSHKDVLDSYGISLNDFNRTNSNFLEITNENDKLGSKILNEDVFNISRTSQSKRFENFGQNRSDSFQSINENEKTSQNVKCKDILEANQRKNEQNFHSGIDTEIKKSSQNLILAKILLNKIQKGNNMVKEQNIDGLNNTATSNVIETSQNLNDDRFEKISKSLKRYFKPVENEKIVENQTISLKSFEAKSNTKSIFETTNGSESLFSSQDAFFSALDTSVSKPKTPEKPVVKKKLCKRKFVPPWKTDGSEAETSKAPRGRVKRPRRKTSFVPPRKLSKKEILNDYDRQRIKVLENADDPGQIEEYLNFINNRPNVQQIQEQQYLALIKRTSDGMEILPPKSPVIKPKKTAIPLERKLSENEFHKILSDGNEDKLKSLLKTQEKMFDFDDTKPNLEFFKENDEKTQHSEFTPAFGSLFDNNVIEDIIKKYLE